MIQSGRLRHRITIQSATESQDTYGEPIKTWSTFLTTWASVEPIKGKEFWESQQVNAQVTHKIIMRHRDGLNPKMRVSWDDRTFEIKAIMNEFERDRKLTLMVTEAVTS